MTITYIYHSCFYVEFESFGILFDYYKDTQAINGYVKNHVLTNDKLLYVLASHAHSDHYNEEILTWRNTHPQIKYLFATEIIEELTDKNGYAFIDKGEKFIDENINVEAFGSTDTGVSFFIKACEQTIFFAGDLNNWHWNEEVPAEEALTYENAFAMELADITKAVDSVDVVFFPVDPRLGRDYCKGAEQFISQIKTGLFIPMHWANRYSKAQAFKKAALKYCREFFNITNKGCGIEWK